MIFAAPTFLAAARRAGTGESTGRRSLYSPWLTANLTLDRLPRERGHGAPLSWDNVIYDSQALGYVDATHQSLRTHSERSVWTYYWSLADQSPADGRRETAQRHLARLRRTRSLRDLERRIPTFATAYRGST